MAPDKKSINPSSATNESLNSLQLRAALNDKVLQGYWLTDVEIVSSAPRFVPIWQPNTKRYAQIVRFALSEKDFGRASVINADKGYRLLAHKRYQSSGADTRVAAIWVESDIKRSRFASAIAFQSAIKQLQRNYPKVDVSVAAFKRGALVFSRAFERTAQCDDCTGLSSGMPFSLGTVSQGVAGVLAARLEYKQASYLGVPFNLSLNWLTKDLMPLMPKHHTHKAIDLLSHRACLKADYTGQADSFSVERFSARELLQQQWHEPLMAGCAAGQYEEVSISGFLYLAAFLESATGRSVEELISQELAQPYKLQSLSVGQFAPKNILGSGLQSSAPDLGLLLSKVLDGELVSSRYRRQRFLKSTGHSQRYSFGWQLVSNRLAELADDSKNSASRVTFEHHSGRILVLLVRGSVQPSSLNKLQTELLSLL